METGFQRGKIQEESLYYEHKKHDGSYPIIGVNTFLNPKGMAQQEIELARSSEDEKAEPAAAPRRLPRPQRRRSAGGWLAKLKQTVIENGNVRGAGGGGEATAPGQITTALFEVGGQYRRSMLLPGHSALGQTAPAQGGTIMSRSHLQAHEVVGTRPPA